MLESATRSSFSGLPTSAQIGFSSTPDTAPGMAGGTGQDVFNLNTSVGRHMEKVLSAEDVRAAALAPALAAAVRAADELPESRLSVSAVYGSRMAPKFFQSDGFPPEEFMQEFVNVARKKNRLRGQQERRTTLRKLLEVYRKVLGKNILLGRNMKEAKMKAIDVKIQRNVQIAAEKHRQIAKCAYRLGMLYGRLRAL